MATLNRDAIRTLAGFKGKDAPVVSLYLDVDGARWVRPHDYEAELDRMLRRVVDTEPGAAEDLAKIGAFVKAGIDRSRTKGLAVFSCVGGGLWQVMDLPVPVRNQLVVNATPHVRQLESVLNNNRRFGLLLVDRQRARLFVFELGELRDRSEVFDQLPRHEDDRGDWDKDHVRDHTADVAQHHFKRAADVAFEVFKAQQFDHLVIGGPDEVVTAFERHLHTYLKDRVAARINLPVASSDSVIREAALAVAASVERASEAELVGRLREAVGGGGAVAGLADTLRALVERRVDTLVVSDGYVAPGWRCRGCGHIATLGRSCPLCGIDMAEVEDAVEEAVEEALNQSCRVEVCVDNADLDVLGRIGALLRF